MAHNPNINLLEQYCPCGCNAHYAYTSIATEPATNTRPNTENGWNNWWMCKASWEEPNLSRSSHRFVWLAIEQMKMLTELNSRVERILVRRILPQYKKSVTRLVVGCLNCKLWESWIRTISNGAPYSEVKHRNLRIASHLENKQIVPFTRVIWRNCMPKLSNVRTQWFRKKWVNSEDGTIYRGHIIVLSFGYNPLTETITAAMEYRTDFFL